MPTPLLSLLDRDESLLNSSRLNGLTYSVSALLLVEYMHDDDLDASNLDVGWRGCIMWNERQPSGRRPNGTIIDQTMAILWTIINCLDMLLAAN
mmetsp:Transcript_26471/g.39829  ORF Transcript_26471/g.39829 Transcript_26471/m.39829 type:complete len:94 (-) Transcript_26471:17-298(-)